MKGLREKFRKNSGFTLIEMLIVVAIIAILIMVSFPMVTSALESSRHAVDQANIRDAISLASIEYLTDTTKDKFKNGAEYTYYVSENHQGSLDSTKGTAITPQCKCQDATSENLKVTVDKDGEITVNWKTDPAKDNATTLDSNYTSPTVP